MPKKPEVTYADLDIALFISSSSAEQVQYVYYDNGKEVARFDSADAGKKWIESSKEVKDFHDSFDLDFLFGLDSIEAYAGDTENLTREVEYLDLGVDKAYETFDRIIEDYKKTANTPVFKGYVSASTGSEVFRHKIATVKKYKGGRAGRKPIYLEAVRQYAIEHHGFKQTRGFIETDDITEALATKAGEKGQLLSLDKDSLCCVGCWLLNENYFDEAVYSDPSIVGWLEQSGDKVIGLGRLYLCYMSLVGDTVDNIGGCPKVGKVKAYNLLKDFSHKPISALPEALAVVAKEYKKVYGDSYEYKHWETGEKITRNWYSMMHEQFQLLYMLKSSKDSAEKSVLKYLEKEKI